MTDVRKRLAALDRTLDDCRRLLILPHNYPDPDAIASALLLSHLVRKRYGISTRIAYGGHIHRAENRAMVQQLEIKMTQVAGLQWSRYPQIAMVDTQPAFGNHSLPADVKPHVVFDHHAKKGAVGAAFEDIRPNYGATTTLLLEYLEAAGVEITVDLATAVIFAIRTETQELGRETSRDDIKSYVNLYPRANKRKLARIINPNLPRTYFRLLQSALQNARVFRNLIHVHLKQVDSPEFVSQIADLLLRHERITWSIVTGRYDGQLFVSLRTSHTNANAGKLLKQLIGKMGSAGGHTTMAGGQVPYHDGKNGEWEKLEMETIARFLKKFRFEKEVDWKPMLPPPES